MPKSYTNPAQVLLNQKLSKESDKLHQTMSEIEAQQANSTIKQHAEPILTPKLNLIIHGLADAATNFMTEYYNSVNSTLKNISLFIKHPLESLSKPKNILNTIVMPAKDDILITEDSEKKNKYSKFVVLVFMDSNLSQKQESIFKALSTKWKNNNDGPMDVIFVNPNDVISHEYSTYLDCKFAPLKNVDNRSLIWCIGHHYLKDEKFQIRGNSFSGWEILASDDLSSKDTQLYSYKSIANLLFHYINDPQIVCDRAEFKNDPSEQKLKIVVPSCFSGVGVNEHEKENVNKSFCGKFFDFLVNRNTEKVLNCIVWGARGLVIPVPGVAKLSNLFKFFFSSNKDIEVDNFHKRYVYVKNNLAATLAPAHQPNARKNCFEIDPSASKDNIKNQNIPIKTSILEEKQTANPAPRFR